MNYTLTTLAMLLAAGLGVPPMSASGNIFAGPRGAADPSGKSWYDIKAAGSGTAEVFIYDEIGYWGITASDFARDLKALGDVSQINLHINSPGGNVFDGVAIYNLLKHHKASVTTHVDGLAASMASVIAMAGDRIVMPDNALMMIHNPWGGAVGDAAEMRKMADVLDKIKASLMTVYIARTGLSEADVTAIMDVETWYTGSEAVAAGFADETSGAVDLAASMRWDLGRLGFAQAPHQLHAQPQPPRGSAAPSAKPSTPQGNSMKTKKMRDAQGNLVLAQVDDNGNIVNILEILEPAAPAAPDAAAVLAAESARRSEIRGAFKGFEADHRAELDACLDDTACTLANAQAKLLAALGANQTPVAKPNATTTTDTSVKAKYRTDVVAALSARINLAQPVAGNPMAGYTLFELARNALQMNGINAYGMSKMDIVAMAFTHTTDDFGNVLADVARRSMLRGYDEAPETFERWTSVGELSDFKAATRVDLGAFPDLSVVPEGAEYKSATVGDRGETVQLATYGRKFSISRQAIINDDLGAFTRIPQKMGGAARRTLGNLVYAVLSGNPNMSDGTALFHADHGNLGSAAAISTASVDAQRVLMQKQKLGDAFLNISPSFLICAPEKQGLAIQTMSAEMEVGASAKANTAPNYVRNLGEVIADARLSGNGWYLAANPAMYDTIEVQYLDGNQAPALEQQAGWDVDGVDFKVRLDAGVKALDFRGLGKNAGA